MMSIIARRHQTETRRLSPPSRGGTNHVIVVTLGGGSSFASPATVVTSLATLLQRRWGKYGKHGSIRWHRLELSESVGPDVSRRSAGLPLGRTTALDWLLVALVLGVALTD